MIIGFGDVLAFIFGGLYALLGFNELEFMASLLPISLICFYVSKYTQNTTLANRSKE